MEFKEREPIFTSEFYYDKNDDDIKKIRDAIEIIEDYLDEAIDQGIIEIEEV